MQGEGEQLHQQDHGAEMQVQGFPDRQPGDQAEQGAGEQQARLQPEEQVLPLHRRGEVRFLPELQNGGHGTGGTQAQVIDGGALGHGEAEGEAPVFHLAGGKGQQVAGTVLAHLAVPVGLVEAQVVQVGGQHVENPLGRRRAAPVQGEAQPVRVPYVAGSQVAGQGGEFFLGFGGGHLGDVQLAPLVHQERQCAAVQAEVAGFAVQHQRLRPGCRQQRAGARQAEEQGEQDAGERDHGAAIIPMGLA